MKSEHLTLWSQREPISHTILLQLFFLYAENIARILFRVLFLYSNHSLKAPLLCSPLRVFIFLKILCLCPIPTLKRIPSDFLCILMASAITEGYQVRVSTSQNSHQKRVSTRMSCRHSQGYQA